VRLTVIGVPVPQGSKTAHPFRRKDGSLGVAVHEGGKAAALKDWRRAIADAARGYWPRQGAGMGIPISGPVFMHVTFYLPRPKSSPKKRTLPDSKPDLSKLIRAVEDALSKIAYEDDARITDIVAHKQFAVDRPPGVEIEISSVAERIANVKKARA
jgi:Holliday junction resolvase RusA-like endonuclease